MAESTETVGYMPKAIRSLSSLEIYELMIAAYPEKFGARDEEGVDMWDEVMEFYDETVSDPNTVERLLARLIYLTMPMGSALNGVMRHALGKPQILRDGSIGMTAAVVRDVVMTPEAVVAS